MVVVETLELVDDQGKLVGEGTPQAAEFQEHVVLELMGKIVTNYGAYDHGRGGHGSGGGDHRLGGWHLEGVEEHFWIWF